MSEKKNEILIRNILLRLPESLHQKIKEQANKSMRSINSEIVYLLSHAPQLLEREEKGSAHEEI
jgi:hypothetical protein